MDNYKVKVENNIDELVSLFGELGCKYFNHTCSVKNYMIFQNGKCFFVKSKKEFNMYECEELTNQELKDMVVLKRNDVGDATHENVMYPYVKLSDGWYYSDKGKSNKWIKSAGGKPSYYANLKPIERKEMKEFLVNHDGKWTLQLLDSDTEENSYRVSVPGGAEILTECGCYKAFWKYGAVKFVGVDVGWDFNYGLTVDDYLDLWGDAAKIVWQRSETEYLMQCVNGDKLMESIAQLKNQETVKVTIDELKHRVYKKDVSHLDFIDVYRVLELFNVQSHAVGHAIKKLLCSGGRGAKDEAQDIQEAIDSLVRYQEMKNEDE